MEPFDLLLVVADVFERLGVRYFVTGSMATIYYGEPRFTNDIDIVAALLDKDVDRFAAAFPASEYYLDADAARDAVRDRGQFNIIHPSSGLKVDVMIPDRDAFNASRFARVRRVESAPGKEAIFASPEDVIIRKLQYHAAGGSDKHLRDIAGVLRIAGDEIDRAYIAEWASRLGVGDTWRVVIDRLADP